MARIFCRVVSRCGYDCPAYSSEAVEAGGGDYDYCRKYKKEIYGLIIKDGFPTFCQLPTESPDVLIERPHAIGGIVTMRSESDSNEDDDDEESNDNDDTLLDRIRKHMGT